MTTPLRSPRPRSQHRSPTASRPRSQQRLRSPRQAGAHRQLTVGSTLTYTVVATNAGNITQSAVTVSDPMLTPGSTTCATLAPGATCTSPVPVSSSRAMSTRARLTTPLRSPRPRSQHRSPTASRPRSQQRLRSPSTSRRPPAASPSARPLTYTVVATNAGNITQSAVTVSDPMLTPGFDHLCNASLRAPHAPSPVPMSSSRAMSTRARLTTPLRSPRPRSQHRSPTASRPRSQQRLRSPSTSRRPPAASPSARP
ncbi:MAG: hypothetical protein IPN50_09145 [Sphingomonadales bacterium]|nr:hypothetical protein [Sphingomonadales bacterium]